MVSKISFTVFGLLLAQEALALVDAGFSWAQIFSPNKVPGQDCLYDSMCRNNNCSDWKCKHSTHGEECAATGDCEEGLVCENEKCNYEMVEVDSSKCSVQTNYLDKCTAWGCCYNWHGGWDNSWCRDRRTGWCNNVCGIHRCDPGCPKGYTCGSSNVCRRSSDGKCFEYVISRRRLEAPEEVPAAVVGEAHLLAGLLMQAMNTTVLGAPEEIEIARFAEYMAEELRD